MRTWTFTGIIATLVIILSIPAYLLKERHFLRPTDQTLGATFLGARKCMDCHKREYDRWHDSHHDHAMEVADDASVLGDFNNAVVEFHGVTSRFYRKEDKYFVFTQGPDGKMGEFEITHTFGWHPLQQYLVPFPGGRLQCLPIAWDVERKRWYNLYPDEPFDPRDWLYWTNAGQNWNGMCAECHSTNLKKNFDVRTGTYQTTWADIDVGCEACHGPGSRHVAWAELPDMARPEVPNAELIVKTDEIDSRSLVELCAPCHSRRAALGDYTHSELDLLDSLLPSLLTAELYYADGQILEEVYVYGSFTQSKMYRREVGCSDCHDVHSARPLKEGNALCLQCHRAAEYDAKTHHFHRSKGEAGEAIRASDGEILFDVGSGAECAQCHMPGRHYMGIDYRPDHSFRVPRPDLTVTLGTPNACNRCHADKSPEWSDEKMTEWYGPGRRSHYGSIITAGRSGLPEAKADLIRLAGDQLYPVVVRATALALLSAYPGEEAERTYEIALMDDEALIRRTAVEYSNIPGQERQAALIAPLIYDPVKAVRMEAARRLAGESSKHLSRDQQKQFQSALEEFVASMEYSGDFAFARYNLGNLYGELNRPEEAVRNYRAALKIDEAFYPAKVNLAMLYNQRGESDKAEVLLKAVVNENPEMFEINYSLGLLLAEKQAYEEAAVYLERAAQGMPRRARVHYNLGLLLQHLKRDTEAEAALLKALGLEPDNMDFLYAGADYYIKRGRLAEARAMAEQMVAKHPTNRMGHELLRFIDSQ